MDDQPYTLNTPLKRGDDLPVNMPTVNNKPTLEQLTAGAQAFGTLASSLMRYENYAAKSAQEEIAVKAAEVAGMQETNARREALLKTLARNRAAAAASGLSEKSGSVQGASFQNMSGFRRGESAANLETELASIAGHGRRRILSHEASQALVGGVNRIGTGLLERQARKRYRGNPYG